MKKKNWISRNHIWSHDKFWDGLTLQKKKLPFKQYEEVIFFLSSPECFLDQIFYVCVCVFFFELDVVGVNPDLPSYGKQIQ